MNSSAIIWTSRISSWPLITLIFVVRLFFSLLLPIATGWTLVCMKKSLRCGGQGILIRVSLTPHHGLFDLTSSNASNGKSQFFSLSERLHEARRWNLARWQSVACKTPAACFLSPRHSLEQGLDIWDTACLHAHATKLTRKETSFTIIEFWREGITWHVLRHSRFWITKTIASFDF